MHALHALAVMAEGPRAASGLDALSLAGTVAYAILGVLLLMVFAPSCAWRGGACGPVCSSTAWPTSARSPPLSAPGP